MELQYTQIINRALAEDIVTKDITTSSLLSKNQIGSATIKAKERGIIAGTLIAKEVFLKVDSKLNITTLINDGAQVQPGDKIMRLEGRITSILKAERVALNFLQHLSGIATKTAQYVEAVKDLPVTITDTRKTIPGLRVLEKNAVRSGGGKNHRMNLGDGILIKDNHIKALQNHALTIKDIVDKIRRKNINNLKVEIEVKNIQEATEAIDAKADIIMLDNMNVEEMRKVVQINKCHSLIEASGGITLENIRPIAESGVNFISIGALTHSAKALDINLKLD